MEEIAGYFWRREGISSVTLRLPAVYEAGQEQSEIWQVFADHAYLFRGTPTGAWLAWELYELFGIEDKLCSETAQAAYDQIEARLASQ